MRSFWPGPKRNGNWLLDDPHPVPFVDSEVTGDAGKDGFTVLSRAERDREGAPPSVPGIKGPCHQGPDNSFEQ